jgi:hypothetical protein
MTRTTSLTSAGTRRSPGEVPVTGYADSGRKPPAGPHWGAGQPDYAPAGLNGAPARLLVNGHYRPEYPPDGRPAREYPYHSGPIPTLTGPSPPTCARN